jgi:lysylphosphatidylglycerol synthetase-like protein (DUF2156 family)
MIRRFAAAGDVMMTTLMQRFGGPVSHVLGDPGCSRFTVPGIEGVIPYRSSPRCRVAIGDPVCAEERGDALAERFRLACERARCSTVYAAASERFAARCVARGYGAIEFGLEQIFDPRRDPTAGRAGREVRKKVHRAVRDGVAVHEMAELESAAIVEEMRAVACEWLTARHGLQMYITPLGDLEHRRGRRAFYALAAGRMVGVLTLVRMDARHGWVFEHLLPRPGAPVGTSELLITHALGVLGDEGITHATFGPAARAHLGRIYSLPSPSIVIGRWVFDTAARLFRLESQLRFREKFQVARREASYLLFFPPRLGLFQVVGLLRAFSAH